MMNAIPSPTSTTEQFEHDDGNSLASDHDQAPALDPSSSSSSRSASPQPPLIPQTPSPIDNTNDEAALPPPPTHQPGKHRPWSQHEDTNLLALIKCNQTTEKSTGQTSVAWKTVVEQFRKSFQWRTATASEMRGRKLLKQADSQQDTLRIAQQNRQLSASSATMLTSGGSSYQTRHAKHRRNVTATKHEMSMMRSRKWVRKWQIEGCMRVLRWVLTEGHSHKPSIKQQLSARGIEAPKAKTTTKKRKKMAQTTHVRRSTRATKRTQRAQNASRLEQDWDDAIEEVDRDPLVSSSSSRRPSPVVHSQPAYTAVAPAPLPMSRPLPVIHQQLQQAQKSVLNPEQTAELSQVLSSCPAEVTALGWSGVSDWIVSMARTYPQLSLHLRFSNDAAKTLETATSVNFPAHRLNP